MAKSAYIDKQRFCEALCRVMAEDTLSGGIGTLGEKSLHKTVKYYLEPDDNYHEIDYLGCVADIMKDGEITEVQTGSFAPLVTKFSRFLPKCKVTLVHPLVAEKTVRKWDDTLGEFSHPRKSPRRKTHFDLGYELYKISRFIPNDNLTVRILYLECEEYKRSVKAKRHNSFSKLECIPRGIIGTLEFKTREDYRVFIPDGLGDEFTAKEYYKAIKSRSRYDYYCLRLLMHLGLIERIGKDKNAYIYKKNI